MKKRIYLIIVTISVFLLIGLFLYTIYLQRNIFENQKLLINVLVNEKIDNFKVHQLISILTNKLTIVENLWWNTIINQSGLSIIFAVVIIIMQIVASEIQKGNFLDQIEKNNKNYFAKITELEKDFEQMIQFTFAKNGPFETKHKFGAIGSIVEQLNILSRMKNNNTEAFSLYKKDLYERYIDYYLKGIIFPFIDSTHDYDSGSSWVNKILTKQNLDRIVFFKTLNEDDRKNIINLIQMEIHQMKIDEYIKNRFIQKQFRTFYQNNKTEAEKAFNEINDFVMGYMN